MNIQSALDYSNQILKRNNIKSFLLDSELLMSEVLSQKREHIILNLKKNLKKKDFYNFQQLVSERSKGKPVAYLTGKKFFWKHEFIVNNKVLIPRPDTELIVEQVLDITKNKLNLNILDIGVGSGCILLSILNEKKGFSGTGIDISSECLKICKKNIKKLGITSKIKLFKSDVDNFDYGKYDLIISNPPYIKKLDLKYLERDVVGFEPKLALDGGLDGISEISKVINKSSELIKKNGQLVLEVACDQKLKVKKLLLNKGFYINKVLKDFANNDRCIISTKI